MLKAIKNEFYKIMNIYKITFYLVSLAIITFMVSFIIKKNVMSDVIDNSYIIFLKYNLNFVLVKFLIPIMMIVITSSIVAEDYSSGVMKFFLISKLKKENLIIGKTLFLVILDLINIIIFFALLSIIGCILFDGSETLLKGEYFKVFNAYIMTSLGMIPIILITIMISLIFDNFQKTLGVSISILIISLILDNLLVNFKGITPTGFITYGYLINTSMDNKAIYLGLLVVYVIFFMVSNTIIFKKKDLLL